MHHDFLLWVCGFSVERFDRGPKAAKACASTLSRFLSGLWEPLMPHLREEIAAGHKALWLFALLYPHAGSGSGSDQERGKYFGPACPAGSCPRWLDPSKRFPWRGPEAVPVRPGLWPAPRKGVEPFLAGNRLIYE